MRRSNLLRLCLAASLALMPATAAAWEPQTTHAGLAEQAALASRLHKRLVSLGFTGGLFEPLTIPPADAPALTAALKLLSPPHGSVPDARGRQSAMAWLTAGAALADIPASQAANHFYDPATGAGWLAPDHGVSEKLRELLGRGALPDRGVPAPDWLTAKTNPFSYDQFLNQYAKAASAATPGERSRYMAAALVAAGAMLHTLGDLGSPARVRGDAQAQLEPLGTGNDDLGSRFERIAALVYGRLGVPGPSRTVTRTHLRDYLSSKDGSGLADIIARSYFSPNTLPETTRVTANTKPQLVRPQPALPAKLNITVATHDDGVTLRSAAGICLARYKVDHDVLRFSLDDDCMIEELAQILPEVAAYETGLLDFLLRGELAITPGDQLAISAESLGAGSLDILVEDDRGVRTKLTTVQTNGTAAAAAASAGFGAAGLAALNADSSLPLVGGGPGAGSGSGSAAPAAGSGSATPATSKPAAGSAAPAAGSGSAAPAASKPAASPTGPASGSAAPAASKPAAGSAAPAAGSAAPAAAGSGSAAPAASPAAPAGPAPAAAPADTAAAKPAAKPANATPPGVVLARVPTPPAGTRIVAVFRGVDSAGEPIVAVGALPLSH